MDLKTFEYLELSSNCIEICLKTYNLISSEPFDKIYLNFEKVLVNYSVQDQFISS